MGRPCTSIQSALVPGARGWQVPCGLQGIHPRGTALAVDVTAQVTRSSGARPRAMTVQFGGDVAGFSGTRKSGK